MDFSSFLTSLGTSFIIFLILMFLFAWLARKPSNNVIYFPNRVLRGLDPYEGSSLSRNPFSWIKEAVSSTEADIVRVSGVDTAVYFVFLTTVLGILVLSGVFLLPVLLPLSMTSKTVIKANDTTSEGSFDDLDRLSMAHIPERSPRLWAFLVGTYWVSFVSYFLLWKAYNHVVHLRAGALMSPEIKNEQFAVLVRDIPTVSKGQTIKEQVDSYFKAIYPETFYRSMVVTDNKKVNEIYEELHGYKKKLAKAEVIYSDSKKTGNPEGTRPTTKTGFLGMCGPKVDAIEHYEEKINELTPMLEAERKITLKDKQQSAAVIFFNNRVTAASASQSLHDKMVDNWTVMEASEPKQILWANLPKKSYQRQIRQYIIYFIVFLTIFFYMIPIGFVSAFTTLENLQKLLPFLKPILDIVAIRTILGAYLPQIALILFLALLPKFLLFLSKAEGIPSESHAQRAASGKYFYFSVLNVFLGVTLGSSLFTTFKDIQKDPNSIVPLLGSSLPGSATFFLTFVALKFFVGYGLELSRIIPLIIFHVKKRYICKTETEVKEAWRPGDLSYATRIPGDMLIVTICLCYSVIAPLIIPFGIVYFGLGWLVLRNQVLKVLVPTYETYGKAWPHLYKRMMAALILYQITMLGYFSVKKFIYTVLLIPLPIISLIFLVICNQKFYRFFFQSTALELAGRELKESPNMDAIFKSYIPPALNADKDEEDPNDHALSQAVRGAAVTSSLVSQNV